MRVSLFKALLFTAVAVVASIATGPLVGLVAAITATSEVPEWAYSGAFSVLLLTSTAVAVVVNRTGFRSLGLVGGVVFGWTAVRTPAALWTRRPKRTA